MWLLHGSRRRPVRLTGEGPEKRSRAPAKGLGRSLLLAGCSRRWRWGRRGTRAGCPCRGGPRWLSDGEFGGGLEWSRGSAVQGKEKGRAPLSPRRLL
jgi:hypothetical protein